VTTFKGEQGLSYIKIAVAVRHDHLGVKSDGLGSQTKLNGRMALFHRDLDIPIIARTSTKPFDRPISEPEENEKVQTIFFRIPVLAIPEIYDFGLVVEDQATGKMGVARQSLTIPSYESEEIMLSDIELVRSILPEGTTTESSGPPEMDLIPNPNKTFAQNEPIHFYYEIYHPHKNKNHKTPFTAQVSVSAKQDSANGFIWRVLSGFGRMVKERLVIKEFSFTLPDDLGGNKIGRSMALDMSGSPPGEYFRDGFRYW